MKSKLLFTVFAVLLLSGCEKKLLVEESSKDGLIKVVEADEVKDEVKTGSSAVEQGDKSFESKNFTEAINFYSKALENSPEDMKTLNSRGVARSESGDYKGAEEDFNRALELMQKRLSDLYENRGYAKFKSGEYEKATADFNRALEFNSNSTTAKINLGVSEKRSGNHQKAFEIYNSIIDAEAIFEKSSWKKSEAIGIEY